MFDGGPAGRGRTKAAAFRQRGGTSPLGPSGTTKTGWRILFSPLFVYYARTQRPPR